MHIFEWLMEWIHQPDTPPAFDTASVISILISADFLQMVGLRRRLRPRLRLRLRLRRRRRHRLRLRLGHGSVRCAICRRPNPS